MDHAEGAARRSLTVQRQLRLQRAALPFGIKAKLHTDFKVILLVLACLVVPFTLTLLRVDHPRPVVLLKPPPEVQAIAPVANPSPLGYTWSLTLFLIPCAALLLWFLRRPASPVQKQAFWWTAGAMAGLGIVLDLCLGRLFFTFENEGAVLGLRFIGYHPADGWQKVIPAEELGFYLLGCFCILLVYIWGDEYWFGAYNVDDQPRHRYERYRDLVSFHPWSAVYGVLFFALGWWYKKHGDHAHHEGFPGYWLFLVTVGLTPSILFYPVARAFVNWRAYSLALIATLFVSLFWEAAVAFPYQWWGYNPQQMMGVFITAFSGLPIEAPILWILVSWAITISYETLYTLLDMRAHRSAAHATA